MRRITPQKNHKGGVSGNKISKKMLKIIFSPDKADEMFVNI
jgi:hypothetical protein